MENKKHPGSRPTDYSDEVLKKAKEYIGRDVTCAPPAIDGRPHHYPWQGMVPKFPNDRLFTNRKEA
jgi:hypothetical protein